MKFGKNRAQDVFDIVVIISLIISFGIVIYIAFKTEVDKTNNCSTMCKPYSVLQCGERYIVCDSPDGGVLKVVKE